MDVPSAYLRCEWRCQPAYCEGTPSKVHVPYTRLSSMKVLKGIVIHSIIQVQFTDCKDKTQQSSLIGSINDVIQKQQNIAEQKMKYGR